MIHSREARPFYGGDCYSDIRGFTGFPATNKTCFHQPGFDLCLESWIKLRMQLYLHSPNEDSLAIEITPHLNVSILMYYARLFTSFSLPVFYYCCLLAGSTCCAISQINPHNSLATAVVINLAFLPRMFN